MRLYLIRHGKAERQSDSGLDADRRLAPRGERQAAWLGGVLRDAERPPGRIIASPAARAARTADLIAEALGLEAERRDEVGLSSTASRVIDLLAHAGGAGGAGGAGDAGDAGGEPSLALVGHNPTLSMVADVLVNGPTPSCRIGLRTGEAAVLELADPSDPVGSATLLGLLRLDD
ncbi:MAG: SixA phosphatase family protein [Phycisphaerales bacterium JB054]